MHQISILSQYGRRYWSLYRPTSVTYSNLFKTQGVGSQPICDSRQNHSRLSPMLLCRLRSNQPFLAEKTTSINVNVINRIE